MDNEMIERIAKAMAASDCGHDVDSEFFNSYYYSGIKESYISMAKVAIKVMREPTTSMLASLHGCYPDDPDKYASKIAKARWQYVIDNILNDN